MSLETKIDAYHKEAAKAAEAAVLAASTAKEIAAESLKGLSGQLKLIEKAVDKLGEKK